MNQKSIWGIKEVRDSAYEDSLFLKKLYPNAKFIYLIRNPFDMYISLKAKEGIFNNFKENRPFYPIEVWNKNVSFFLNEEKMKEIDGFLIKYEDIIEPSNSRTLLDELVKYLSIEFHDKMLEELSVKVGNSTNKNKQNKWFSF